MVSLFVADDESVSSDLGSNLSDTSEHLTLSAESTDTEIVPTSALYTKKSRGGSRPRAIDLWKHSRVHLPHEEERNAHNQKIFYCKYCSWRSVISNAAKHVKNHGVGIEPDAVSLARTAGINTLKASFSNQERVNQSKTEAIARITLKNAVNKASYRAAVARFITACSISHRVVEHKEFKNMCLSLNWMAGHALMKSHSSIPRRIASNFEYQRDLVKSALHNAVSCIQLCTDSWTSSL
jgi:hypothetical protein